MSQHLGLTFEIDVGINVGGVDRDVAEPGTDGVDVHAGAEQMCGRGVPDDVRADAFPRERWTSGEGLVNISSDETMYAVAGDSATAVIHEDARIR